MRHTRRPLAPAAALVVLAAGCPLAGCTPGDGAPERTAAEGVVGAASAGDPLFPDLGNGGYDVGHYRLRLDYDTAGRRLDGAATVTATATRPLRAFSLDFSGPAVRRVTVDGETARYGSRGRKVVVRPASVVGKGDTFRTTVVYRGAPKPLRSAGGGVEGWIPTDDGAFVAGEPAGSTTWFPGNHHPGDKAAYDFEIRVPEGDTAVANGELRGKRSSRGRTTFHWRTEEPMASYLATATIGRFEVERSRTGRGLPLHIAVDPREAAEGRKTLARLEEVVDFGSELFGPYPFSSAGAIVDHAPEGVGYALETQTKALYPRAPEIRVVVHEMAHEWFGNSVTPESWRDLWLNEGFATYAEWLWSERHGGDSAQRIFERAYARGADDPLWAFPPARPTARTLFDEPVYVRGAMVLHRLRSTVGDRAFFAVLKGWHAEHRHGNAGTEDFTAFCERRTGRDLDALFDTWLYGEGRPARP